MPVRDGLVLDHLYAAVTEEEFQGLLPLQDLLAACAHSRVKSGADEWEGLYLYTRTGSYLELLRARRDGGIGLAWTARVPYACDARRIETEQPDLTWKTGTRLHANGDPWFDWLSTGDYLDVDAQKLNAWIMCYHTVHVDRVWPRLPRVADHFKSVTVELGRDRLDEVLALVGWSPAAVARGQHIVTLTIPERTHDVMELRLALVEGDEWFRLREVELQMVRGFRIAPRRLGAFELRFDERSEVLRLVRWS